MLSRASVAGKHASIVIRLSRRSCTLWHHDETSFDLLQDDLASLPRVRNRRARSVRPAVHRQVPGGFATRRRSAAGYDDLSARRGWTLVAFGSGESDRAGPWRLRIAIRRRTQP